MTAVPDRVLSWLYSSLKAGYQDPNRAYSDIAKTLSYYSSFSPRTEVYTYENGSTALLLQLHGTLPVSFRGNVYKFPMMIWFPHRYPMDPPILYVVPTQEMSVRPSQHVSTEGRIYHPYLAHWSSHWDKSSILDFLLILKDVFTKEPPLVSTQLQSRPPPQRSFNSNQRNTPPPRPPPPEELRRPSPITTTPSSSLRQQTAPTPPPKPGARAELSAASPSPIEQQRPPPTMGVPVVPPKVGSLHTEYRSPGNAGIGGWKIPDQSVRPRPPPHLPQQTEYHATPTMTANRSSFPDTEYGHSGGDQGFKSPFNAHATQYAPSLPPPGDGRGPPQTSIHGGQAAPAQIPSRSQAYGAPKAPGAAPPPQTIQPVPDLLSGPLEVSLPSQTSQSANIPAPPIPPNPEKDALLTAIATTLRSQLESTVAQNTNAVSALEAQHGALQQAHYKMQAEISQLQQLDAMLSSNEKILRDAMIEAERVMDNVEQREKPNVDEVLVAPTVVGEQLYGLVADEKSITEAMFLLTRALDKGRIGGDVFVKQTRTLAREQFLKKALIRKIAQGMGLATYDYQ